MKIDLYNNHEQYIKEQRQDWAIAKWCLKKGITVNSIMDHPQFTDVAFLLEFRTEFEKEYKTNRTLMATVNAYWKMVYSNNKPLKKKSFIKLEIIANQCLQIREQQNHQKQIIKQLRANKGNSQKQNIGHDNKAKGPCLPGVANIAREQQECHAVPTVGCVNHKVCDAHELWW